MDLLTIPETARLLRVTPITVRRYIAAGRLPAVRVGKGIRVRREAVDDLITPVVPTRDPRGSDDQEQGGRLRQSERTAIPRLTDAETQQVLAAIETARRLRAELTAQHAGELVPSSVDLLHAAREQRTRERS
jgi:excisionase family DNA binding protein